MFNGDGCWFWRFPLLWLTPPLSCGCHVRVAGWATFPNLGFDDSPIGRTDHLADLTLATGFDECDAVLGPLLDAFLHLRFCIHRREGLLECI